MTDTTFTLLQNAALMLGNLRGLLEKAETQAKAAGKDPNAYIDARIAPDMFNLARQVQFACFGPVNGAARLLGRPAAAPGEPDTTFTEMKARIAAAITGLEALNAADFDGASGRDVVQPMQGTRVMEMKGLPYVRDWLMPNFYFHLVTAYDILRNQGVEIGKRDYLAHNGKFIRDTAESAA